MAVGLEGYAVSRISSITSINFSPALGTYYKTVSDTRTIGAGLATITLRYPIGASRFTPYVFAGGGVIAGGGQKIRHEFVLPGTPGESVTISTSWVGSETEAIGQFGGGLEIRLTHHVGLINDVSWNVVNRPHNNFGMARTGINFAF